MPYDVDGNPIDAPGGGQSAYSADGSPAPKPLPAPPRELDYMGYAGNLLKDAAGRFGRGLLDLGTDIGKAAVNPFGAVEALNKYVVEPSVQSQAAANAERERMFEAAQRGDQRGMFQAGFARAGHEAARDLPGLSAPIEHFADAAGSVESDPHKAAEGLADAMVMGAAPGMVGAAVRGGGAALGGIRSAASKLASPTSRPAAFAKGYVMNHPSWGPAIRGGMREAGKVGGPNKPVGASSTQGRPLGPAGAGLPKPPPKPPLPPPAPASSTAGQPPGPPGAPIEFRPPAPAAPAAPTVPGASSTNPFTPGPVYEAPAGTGATGSPPAPRSLPPPPGAMESRFAEVQAGEAGVPDFSKMGVELPPEITGSPKFMDLVRQKLGEVLNDPKWVKQNPGKDLGAAAVEAEKRAVAQVGAEMDMARQGEAVAAGDWFDPAYQPSVTLERISQMEPARLGRSPKGPPRTSPFDRTNMSRDPQTGKMTHTYATPFKTEPYTPGVQPPLSEAAYVEKVLKPAMNKPAAPKGFSVTQTELPKPPAGPKQSGPYKPGDQLPNGKFVHEVDEMGRPLVVGRRPPAGPAL